MLKLLVKVLEAKLDSGKLLCPVTALILVCTSHLYKGRLLLNLLDESVELSDRDSHFKVTTELSM